MYTRNEKLKNSFWQKRLSDECKAHGVKICKDYQNVKGLASDEERLAYLKTFADSVVSGMAGKIQAEDIEVKTNTYKGYPDTYFHLTMNLLPKDKKEYYRAPYSVIIPCLHVSLSGDNITGCSISVGSGDGHYSTRTLCCGQPEKLGEILAGLYDTLEADTETVKKSIAKADKMQQLISTSLQAALETHLKGSGLLWAIDEKRDGKIELYVKFTPRKVLSMTIESGKFDNDFSKILETIDSLDVLLRKKNVNMTVRGEQSMIKWHET